MDSEGEVEEGVHPEESVHLETSTRDALMFLPMCSRSSLDGHTRNILTVAQVSCGKLRLVILMCMFYGM